MPTRVLMKPDPLGVPRNPLAIYLLALALLSGLMTLFGEPAAQSVEAALAPYVVKGWGFMLAFGAGHTLLGMFWQGRQATGLLMKRIGMFTLTIASFVYAAVVILSYGTGGVLSAGVIAGFGVACALQYKRLNDRVKAIIEVTVERREGRDGPSARTPVDRRTWWRRDPR